MLERVFLTDGCCINHAEIRHSIVGLRSQIRSGVRIIDTIMMGSDYYDRISACNQEDYPLGVNEHDIPLGLAMALILKEQFWIKMYALAAVLSSVPSHLGLKSMRSYSQYGMVLL